MFKFLPATLLALSTLAWGQTNLVDWASTNDTSPADHPAPRTAEVVQGGLQTFADRASFDAEFPAGDQSCEDFEANLFNDGDIIGFPAPLDASTDNSVFAAGSIMPGITILDDPLNDSGGGAPSGLVAVGAGFGGAPSDIVLANTFADSLVVQLSPAEQNLAFDVFSHTAGGTATVTFFDGTDSQIGQLSVGATPSAGGFVGVSSPVPIARIEVSSVDSIGDDEAEGVDDFCISGAPVPTLESVPVMGLPGAAVLAALFVLLTVFIGRRHFAG